MRHLAALTLFIIIGYPAELPAAEVCLELPAAKIQEAQEYADPANTPTGYVRETIKNRVLRDLRRKRQDIADQTDEAARAADEGAF